ncbi:ankyrin repeat-containing domain protein [Cladorrhinum samala]|uniref:Ankyrin repeat-containing domain protein n=1 Tax=Cladorrhinum samala TaxID=585594 RepID=A0AAV9HL84_9PEZI|nr:ankyrin repeat-containing domain protein [Cladorrhinum samala]
MASTQTSSNSSQCNQKVKQFLDEYKKPQTQKLFQDLADATKHKCEEILASLNIKGVVQSRSKKYDSLTTKLTGMARDPEFVSWSAGASSIPGTDPRRGRSVYEHPDMGDLSGVRIGLFFPDDIAIVGKKINQIFDISHTFGTVIDTSRSAAAGRNFDVQKHEQGRWASEGSDGKPEHWEHYGYKSWQVVVTWKQQALTKPLEAGIIVPLMKSFGSQPPPRIEIQVGTIVTQAWAEVQHNIIYKNPRNIQATPTMKRMIDAINGLAITTDIMLRELQRSQTQAKNEAAEWQALGKKHHHHLMAQACMRGDALAVKQLLQKGVDVNITSEEGRSVLWQACGYGNYGVVQELLKQDGIQVNVRGRDDGQTPLFAAVIGGEDKIVELLIQKGIDVNAKDKNGQTALFLACEKRDDMMVSVLLKGGIDANIKDKQGLAVLHMACQNGEERALERLLRHQAVDVNLRESHGMTALHLASKFGREKVVKQLLASRRVDVNAKDTAGNTALDCATTWGQAKVVEILRAAGGKGGRQISGPPGR